MLICNAHKLQNAHMTKGRRYVGPSVILSGQKTLFYQNTTNCRKQLHGSKALSTADNLITFVITGNCLIRGDHA
jgi:hypothetical protein